MKKIDYLKRTNKKLQNYREELLKELDCLDHVLECSLKNYDFMINFAIEKGFDEVVDIGCAYGHQSELCEGRIKYIGIDREYVNFYKPSKCFCLIEGYPNNNNSFNHRFTDSLAISNLCVGWNCYVDEKEALEQFKALKKDFKASLLQLPKEREKLLKKVFGNVEKIKNKSSRISAFYYCY